MLSAVLHREAPQEQRPFTYNLGSMAWAERALMSRLISRWQKETPQMGLRSQGLWQLALWTGPGFSFGPYRPWTMPAPPDSYVFLNVAPQGFWLARKSKGPEVVWSQAYGLDALPPMAEGAMLPDPIRPLTWGHVAPGSLLPFSWGSSELGALTTLWSGGVRCLLKSQALGSAQPQGPIATGVAKKGAAPKAPPTQWHPTCLDTPTHVTHKDPLTIPQEFVVMAGPSARCVPVGSRPRVGAEVFGGDTGPACIFSFSSVEPRLPEGPTSSRIFCLNQKTGSFVVTDAERALGVFPMTQKGFYNIYEGAYRPPRITTLSLAPMTQAPPTLSIGGWGRGQRGAAWDREVGVYACQGNHRPLTEALDQLPHNQPRTWLMVPREVYTGYAALDEAQHQVVAVTRDPFRAEVLPWSQAAQWYPALNDFPSMSCVFQPHLDVKCALRVVQHTGQIAVENLLGLYTPEHLDPAIAESLFLMCYDLLKLVNQKLMGWQLESHTYRLANHFGGQLKRLNGTKYGQLKGWPLLPPNPKPPTLMRYLNLPWGLWTKL